MNDIETTTMFFALPFGYLLKIEVYPEEVVTTVINPEQQEVDHNFYFHRPDYVKARHQIAELIDKEDFEQAKKLLDQLNPNDPQKHYYGGLIDWFDITDDTD